jgi:S-DNA-T family DNA segregation ATPase FtsK/SpoIIIE
MKDAVELLRQLKKEMDDRFTLLEEKNHKSIDPARDNKERIIVGVDEASVLYTKPSRHDPDFELAVEARYLTDSLAKLSRAAGMHLILATQKLIAEVLPTTITDNISLKVCFKAESVNGSQLVLGSTDAYHMPKIKGRGIWRLGDKQQMFQAPYVTEKEVQEFSKQIAEQFKEQKRKSLTEMVGQQQNRANKRQQDAVRKAKEPSEE